MRLWVSWEEPGKDSRPLKVPPPPEVKAWWESGIGNGYTTVCAVIDTDRCDIASLSRLLQGWWACRSWRFVEEVADDWRPGDRFPWPTEVQP